MIEIRRLLAEDAALYRQIRQDALIETPDAFASTTEDEQDSPLDRFAARLADSIVLGAFDGAELAGMAGFFVQPKARHRHKGILWGMYVRPQHRDKRIGRQLVEAIIAVARPQVELVQLFVVSDNTTALRLYQSLGFVEYGRERHATKYRGRYHDDVLMVLFFESAETAAEANPA